MKAPAIPISGMQPSMTSVMSHPLMKARMKPVKKVDEFLMIWPSFSLQGGARSRKSVYCMSTLLILQTAVHT